MIMKKKLFVISAFSFITSMGMQNAFGMKRLWNAIASRFSQLQVAVAVQPEVTVPAVQGLQDHQSALLNTSQTPEKKKTKSEEPGAQAVQSFSLFPLISLPEKNI